MDKLLAARCVRVTGDDYSEWAAINEIGPDEWFRRAGAREPLTTASEDEEYGVSVLEEVFRFTSEEDRAQALALARHLLDHAARGAQLYVRPA